MTPSLLADLPPFAAAPGERTVWAGAHDPVTVFVAAALAARVSRPVVAVAASEVGARECAAVAADLLTPLGVPVLRFPGREVLPYDVYSPPPDLVAERTALLARLPDTPRVLAVVDAPTLSERLPPPEHIAREAVVLDVGQTIPREGLRQRLVAGGYRLVPQVEEPGEIAVRGAVLDLFPLSETAPLRIEFLDDTVVSLRRFRPEAQRSTTEKVERVRILPAREYPLDEDARERFRRGFRARIEGEAELRGLYRRLEAGDPPEGLEAYLPLFFPATVHLFDYLHAPPVVCWFAGAREALAAHLASVTALYERHRGDYDRPPLVPEEAVWTARDLEEKLAPTSVVELRALPEDGVPDLGGRPLPEEVTAADEDALAAALATWCARGGSVVVTGHAPLREMLLRRALERLPTPPAIDACSSWAEIEGGGGRVTFVRGHLREGALWGSRLLLSLDAPGETPIETTPAREGRRGRDFAALLRDLTDLRPGDPVVHEDHGVGRYRGLVRLEVDGVQHEFLLLEYLGGDRLYVPVTRLDRVGRYLASGEGEAPWHRLGGRDWERLRRRSEQRIHDVAAELLALEARRKTARSPVFKTEGTDYARFAAVFPYTLTEDQETALQATLADLARPRPMNRLLCGDVGFGKTEVALRAAYLAAACGHQTVVLVPTTLLARQHYETFLERCVPFGIRVGLLSRFRSERERAASREAFMRGEIDILISTHAVLSGDLRPPRLGLLVIDEEQQFGVRQKEALRRLKAEVHTLLLSATPIPRTLHMALGGLVDLSLLSTPPPGRLAVVTSLGLWEDALLAEALERESRRGGQVYVVHPTVEGIEELARRVRALAPGLEVRTAHGEMPARVLEKTMEDFYHGRFPILVSTKIVGHGLDVPNANTLIVNHAHRFGLGELHQLRGRVGRSRHRAFAYLVVPTLGGLPHEARARLEALTNHQDPGSGFLLAVQDLEIRGAGRLLGEDQSGVIDDLGFGLYSELLERTVRRLGTAETGPDEFGKDEVEIDVHASALLPESYLPDVGLRLLSYRRLSAARDESAIAALGEEFRDRFGPLPPEAERLLAVLRLARRAHGLGIRRIDLHARGGSVEFLPAAPLDPARLVALVSAAPERYRLEPPARLRLRGSWPEPDARLAFVEELLERLSSAALTVHDPAHV
jgi:transcription-repair coupling factor (superfamily II helicase)